MEHVQSLFSYGTLEEIVIFQKSVRLYAEYVLLHSASLV